MSLKEQIRVLKYNILGRGKNWSFEHPVRLIKKVTVDKNVSIGRYTYIVSGRIYGDTRIGRYCSIAENVIIGPANHPINWLSTSPVCYGGIFPTRWEQITFNSKQKTTVIGNDVWIGANAFIKRGVVIGDGAIIGAGAVVVKDVPPYAIVGGNPAKIIRFRFETNVIDKMMELKWWELDDNILSNLPYDKIEDCIREIENRKKQFE